MGFSLSPVKGRSSGGPSSHSSRFTRKSVIHLQNCIDLPRQTGVSNEYWYAPGDYLETLDRSELEAFFTMEEQKEFADYIYLTEDLIQLKGNKFSKKRNLIHQFFREYMRHGRVTVENIHKEQIEECLQFLEIWCNEHVCDVDQESESCL